MRRLLSLFSPQSLCGDFFVSEPAMTNTEHNRRIDYIEFAKSVNSER